MAAVALSRAAERAVKRGDTDATSTDLLDAMAELDGCTARRILATQGLAPDRALHAEPPHPPAAGFASDLLAVIGDATAEAAALASEQVGTGHLLVAMLRRAVIERLDVLSYERVRADVAEASAGHEEQVERVEGGVELVRRSFHVRRTLLAKAEPTEPG